jgi:hypothetical protein
MQNHPPVDYDEDAEEITYIRGYRAGHGAARAESSLISLLSGLILGFIAGSVVAWYVFVRHLVG